MIPPDTATPSQWLAFATGVLVEIAHDRSTPRKLRLDAVNELQARLLNARAAIAEVLGVPSEAAQSAVEALRRAIEQDPVNTLVERDPNRHDG